MALSGTIQKTFSTGYTLKTDWSATQNISGNYSTVTCSHKLVCANSYDLYIGSRSNSCIVGGVSKAFSSPSISTGGGSTITLGTTTHQINHNSDGTASVGLSTTFNIKATLSGKYIESITASETITLNTIPRKSGVTCNSFYIGDSTTINISRASNSFTHTIKYVYGYLSGTLATKTSETSIGWTPPAVDFYGQIPNGTTGYGSVTCETYSGDTLVGTSTANFNAYAKESDCIPDVSATIVDTNTNTIALTGDSSKLIKYLSMPKVTVNASSKNSAAIRTRKMTWGDGQTSTDTTTTFNNGVTNSNVTVSATDSRGYSKAVSYNLSSLSRWVEYVKLAFSNIVLSRTESTSSTVNMKVSGNYFNGSFGAITNSFSLKYRYKEEGGDYNGYTEISMNDIPRTNDTFDYSDTLNDIDYKKQYIFEFVVEDAAMVVSSGERVLEKGEAIFRVGQDYTRTNGRILDEYGTELRNGLSKYRDNGVDINPDTTIEELILTETNTPTGGFWYVRTMFYADKNVTSNRTQIAYPYAYDSNVRACTYMRTYVNGIGWSSWALISARGEAGWVSITPVANTPTTVYVAFKNKYNKIPNVVTSAGSGAIGTQVLGTATNGITTTGVNIVLTRTNTTPTTVYFQVLEEV